MSLEATLIMLDNSSYSLNGDYMPTRWQSQIDSASLLIQSKLQANLQSSVGLGLMGGRQVQILCTMTSDSVKANSYLFGNKIYGQLHFVKALQIGALALKHRLNETQKQRMICFIGSTIAQDAETLKIIGKKLKKNGIAVDLICFGDCSQDQKAKVQAFMKSIEHQQNSHSLFIEPGQVYLSQKLIGTPIFSSDGGSMAPGGGNLEVDDPELAAAIRMSLQENQQAQKKQQSVPKQGGKQVKNEIQQPSQQELERLAIEMSLAQMKESQKKQQKKQDKKQQ